MKQEITLLFLNSPAVLVDRITTLAEAIAPRPDVHGYRDWLKEAIEAHLTGKTIPAPF